MRPAPDAAPAGAAPCFAVGGNVEAARRAGIHVDALVSVFVAVLDARRGRRHPRRGAARGREPVQRRRRHQPERHRRRRHRRHQPLRRARLGATSALLGILVIQSIANGLDLLSLDSAVKFMITGAVLLLAVIIDALARRGRTAHGRA